MPKITLTATTADAPAIIDALCKADGYTGKPDIAHAKQAIIAWIVATVQNVQTAQQPLPAPPAPITGLS